MKPSRGLIVLLLVFLISLIALLLSRLPAGGFVVVSSVTLPPGWTEIVDADTFYRFILRIKLRSPRSDEFSQHVLDVSTPGHPSYGQHLDSDSSRAFLRPNASSIASVRRWLEAYGVEVWFEDDGSGPTDVLVSTEQAEALLNTKYSLFRNEHGREIIRTLEYSVPKHLAGIIQTIHPTTRFEGPEGQRLPTLPTKSNMQRMSPAKATMVDDALQDLAIPHTSHPQTCNASITPDCLRDLYGLGTLTSLMTSNYSLGISGFLNQFARWSDWGTFADSYAPWIQKGSNFSVVMLNGGVNPQNDFKNHSLEASLDIQYAMALAPNIPTVYYSTPGRGPLVPEIEQPSLSHNSNEPYLDQLTYLIDLPDEELPKVLSYSYGENEQSVPKDYAVQICTVFAQLAIRGVSIIFSSGDAGPGDACLTNDGQERLRFMATFPATCPWVTAVGGTTDINPEKATDFSSGGFSDIFAMPPYQKPAVSAYLAKQSNAFQGLYSPEGRGFPDVSAQSVGFNIIDKGQEMVISGTSASAPVFAAIVANLNRIRSQQGKPPLGLLNPWLYSLKQGQGLTDIVHSRSEGCEYTNLTNAGWNATEGWDAVTGLGTPRFEELVAAMP